MPDPTSYIAALTVLGGPLKGRDLFLQEAVDDVLIGSDPDCRLILDAPGVSPLHARIWLDNNGAVVYDTRSARGVYVNDQRVTDNIQLADGDFIWLGPPGDADSVLLQFRYKAQHAAAPAAVADEWAIAEPFDEPETPALPDEPLGALVETEFFVEEQRVPAEPDFGGAPLDVDEFVVGDEFVVEAPRQDVDFVLQPPEEPVSMKPAPPAVVPVAPVPAAPVTIAAAPSPPVSTVVSAPPAAAVPPVASRTPASPPLQREARPRTPAPRPTSVPARAATKPAPSGGRNLVKWLVPAAGVLVLLAIGGYFLKGYLAAPRIETISPTRVAPGDKIVVTGRNFAAEGPANTVRFGNKDGKLVKSSATQLEVQVPELPTPVGHSTPIAVIVRVAGRDSKPGSITLYRAPRVHGIAPSVAMPGEEIALAGSGWANGAKVTIGGHDAQILELTPTSLRVRVPALSEAPGTSLPVIVQLGDDASNPAPFYIGRVPLITAVEPTLVSSGDVVAVRGRGFAHEPAANDLRMGGQRALVVASAEDEIQVVVPRIAGEGGEVPLELRVPNASHVGTARLTLGPPGPGVDFRFVAEPWEDVPGHDHALLSTGLGPSLVLSASGGRRAADRALLAQQRLNAAAASLKASLAADLEVRQGSVIALVGRDEPLFEATDDDVRAYDEDWTKLKGKGGPATRGRLAVWWSATIRDLVLLLLRSEKPRHAVALAPEGRVLMDVYDAARKTGSSGVPREVVAKGPPRLHEGLRMLALRVPPTVKEPESTAASGPARGEIQHVTGLWSGWQTDEGERMSITVSFTGETGTLTYERTLTLTLPILKVEQSQKDTLRFSLQSGERLLRYVGTVDGESMKGKIFSEAAGGSEIGTFELERKR